jgi:hypothetical protein
VRGKELRVLSAYQGQQVVQPSKSGFATCKSDNFIWHYLISPTFRGHNKCSGNTEGKDEKSTARNKSSPLEMERLLTYVAASI